MRTSDLRGATVLVTGAASGIGRAVALRAAHRGGGLIVCDIDEDGLAEVAGVTGRLGVPVLARRADVADAEQMQDFAAAVRREGRPVDILVNNAGVGLAGGFFDTELIDWDWVLATNLLGVVHGCRFFVPDMVTRGSGHVVNIASLTGFRPSPAQVAYSAAKAAVMSLSEALRLELRPHGIGVSVICPGVVNTPLPQHARWRGVSPGRQARVTARFQQTGCSPDLVADQIFRAVQRNRSVVPVTRHAQVAYWTRRVSPALSSWLAEHRGSLR